MKHKHKYLTLLLAVTLIALQLLTPSWAAAASQRSNSGLTCTVTVRQSGQGSLYWDCNQSGNFFYQGGEIYNRSCLAAGTSCRFTALSPRRLIAEPAEGWYFDGFYSPSGQKLYLETQRIDVVRVAVRGVYFYDSVVSYSDPGFKNVTKAKYMETVRAYLKTLYGTTRFKVMETLDTYKVPLKTQTLQACFKEKKMPVLTVPQSLQKSVSSSSFYAVKDIPAGCQPAFRSSSSKVLTVDQATGLCTVKGEGIAVVTLTVPASKETLRGEWKISVSVYPEGVPLTSAVRSRDKKSVAIKWKPDTLCSGYEIQTAADKTYAKITAKKTVSSGKTASTKLTTKKDSVCRYLRIRPYKKSRGEKLYGPWTEIPVK